MAGYMDSKYYELQNELIHADLMLTDEGLAQDLKNYEDELNWPDNGGDWLAAHFNSTPEYLLDCSPDELSDEEFQRMVDRSRKEIEITRKANGGRYENFARMYEEWLDEAINNRWIWETGKILEA